MKKLSVLLIALHLSFAFGSFAQSRPQSPQSGAKQNRRPAATPTPTPEATPETSLEEAPVGTDDGEVITIDTSLVAVPVKVFDRSGRYVPNLKQEDFRVFEDKIEQEISYFNGVEQPFTVVLMLDMSYSTVFKTTEIQSAAIAFTAQLRPHDKVMAVSFAQDVNFLCNPTSDRKLVREAILKTQLGGGTSIYDAVEMTFERLKKISGRKAIVLFTDGVNTSSVKATYDSNLAQAEEFDALIFPIQYDTYQDVQNASAIPGIPGQGPNTPSSTRLPPSVSNPLPFPLPMPMPRATPTPTPDPTRGPLPQSRPVGLPGTGSSEEDYATAGRYLQQLAYLTGGKVEQASTKEDMALAFSRIADELRQIYTIGYYPKETENKTKKRRIQVKVNRPKSAVKARDSYILGEKQTKK